MDFCVVRVAFFLVYSTSFSTVQTVGTDRVSSQFGQQNSQI